MLKSLLTIGLSGEPIHWTLISQQSHGCDTVYILDAPSKLFSGRTYHAYVTEGVSGSSYRYTIE